MSTSISHVAVSTSSIVSAREGRNADGNQNRSSGNYLIVSNDELFLDARELCVTGVDEFQACDAVSFSFLPLLYCYVPSMILG